MSPKTAERKTDCIGSKKDNKFSCFQAEMLKLKEDYIKNNKIIKTNFDQIQKDDFSCNKNLMHSKRIDNVENIITELQKSFSLLKSEFSFKFDKFKTKFLNLQT